MVETILRVIIILIIISIVLAVLGSVSVSFNITFGGYIELMTSFLHCICYILPFKKLMPIFVIVVAFSVFKIAISILRTIWDIFPIRG